MPINRRLLLKISSLAALSASIESVLGAPLKQSKQERRMPAMFIGHGSPMNAIADNAYTRKWQQLGEELSKPKLILSISAHWQSRGASYITSNPKQRIIYDMSGFPKALYQVQYPALGAPDSIADISKLIDHKVLISNDWGLDHGSWLVLKHMYPNADVPVLQLSMDANLTPQQHFEIGQQLASLREQGVLIMGTGNLVHNLPRRGRRGSPVFPWAEEFDQIISSRIAERDFKAAINFQSLGQLSNLAHPSHEHFLPLLYALGTADEKDTLSWFNQGFYKGSISMRCLLIS